MTSNSGSPSFPFSFSSFTTSWRAQDNSSSSYSPSYASSTSSDSSSSFVGPEPPVVLPPETNNDGRPSSPHQSFLSSGPPVESPVEVETLPSEYRVQVRLPGFKRELITLATKRRRVLHLVANRWENGGGHFERRIAFGYDADLVHVKAEFDGELLRVKIPRYIAYIPQTQGHNAPIGRTS